MLYPGCPTPYSGAQNPPFNWIRLCASLHPFGQKKEQRRMKTIVSGLFCCAVICGPAMAQKTGGAALSDQAFVDMAAQIDMTEANLGQLAGNQGSSQGVKDLGQMLATDHTSDYTQLSATAAKANLTVPKGLDEQHQRMIAPFEKLKGKAFDRRYVQEMVAGHKKAIAAFNKEVQDGQNADLKAYAQQVLPVLEKHETAAQALQKAK
jgi:putative membrane protein